MSATITPSTPTTVVTQSPIDPTTKLTSGATTTTGPLIVSVFSMGLLAACLGIAYMGKDLTMLNVIEGAILSMATSAFHFYVGTSSGSQSKDATIARMGS